MANQLKDDQGGHWLWLPLAQVSEWNEVEMEDVSWQVRTGMDSLIIWFACSIVHVTLALVELERNILRGFAWMHSG